VAARSHHVVREVAVLIESRNAAIAAGKRTYTFKTYSLLLVENLADVSLHCGGQQGKSLR